MWSLYSSQDGIKLVIWNYSFSQGKRLQFALDSQSVLEGHEMLKRISHRCNHSRFSLHLFTRAFASPVNSDCRWIIFSEDVIGALSTVAWKLLYHFIHFIGSPPKWPACNLGTDFWMQVDIETLCRSKWHLRNWCVRNIAEVWLC